MQAEIRKTQRNIHLMIKDKQEKIEEIKALMECKNVSPQYVLKHNLH